MNEGRLPQGWPYRQRCHATNNKGSVTGTYYDSAGDVHGWLLDGGKYYAFNDPTGCKCDTRSDGINDSNVVEDVIRRPSAVLASASKPQPSKSLRLAASIPASRD
ncbi:MAG: hypothetical protein WBE44_15780 [Terriglobales bacterium]